MVMLKQSPNGIQQAPSKARDYFPAIAVESALGDSWHAIGRRYRELAEEAERDGNIALAETLKQRRKRFSPNTTYDYAAFDAYTHYEKSLSSFELLSEISNDISNVSPQQAADNVSDERIESTLRHMK